MIAHYADHKAARTGDAGRARRIELLVNSLEAIAVSGKNNSLNSWSTEQLRQRVTELVDHAWLDLEIMAIMNGRLPGDADAIDTGIHDHIQNVSPLFRSLEKMNEAVDRWIIWGSK